MGITFGELGVKANLVPRLTLETGLSVVEMLSGQWLLQSTSALLEGHSQTYITATWRYPSLSAFSHQWLVL